LEVTILSKVFWEFENFFISYFWCNANHIHKCFLDHSECPQLLYLVFAQLVYLNLVGALLLRSEPQPFQSLYLNFCYSVLRLAVHTLEFVHLKGSILLFYFDLTNVVLVAIHTQKVGAAIFAFEGMAFIEGDSVATAVADFILILLVVGRSHMKRGPFFPH